MFAGIYDVLMSDVDYEALLIAFEPYLNKNQIIIDAGCGTGYFLKELLASGYDALGLDMDSDMLKMAKDKLIKAQLPQPLYEHDLRKPLGIKADVIFCLFDVINYFKGTKKVFENIYQALNEKGICIFDVYKSDVMPSYDNYHESDEIPLSYDWHISYQSPILKHNLIVDQKKYQTKQYVYDISYYQQILKDLKFKHIDIKSGLDSRKHYIVAYK